MKWFSKSKKVSPLAKLLESYPAYKAPYTARNHTLTESQAGENLAYLLENKQARLEHLTMLLQEFDIGLTAQTKQEDATALIDSLYRWAREQWPTAVKADLATRGIWQTTHRQDDQIIYSVIMDTAIALADLSIQHRPTFQWALDLDPVNIKDEMASAKRPVIQANSVVLPGKVSIVDWEQAVMTQLVNRDMVAYQAINQWQKIYDEIVSGLVEGTWAEDS